MDDSDEEGFHQAPLEFMYINIKNMNLHSLHRPSQNNVLANNPISLHYELHLYIYPRQLDAYREVQSIKKKPPSSQTPLDLVKKGDYESKFLSEFFPRKLSCVYNKFQQNLLLKHDMTIIIRNMSRRICSDQLTSISEKSVSIHKTGLVFSSDFEGGNLHCVFKCKKTGFYYLFIQNDVNTHGYNIWFHFNIRAAHPGKHQFVIVNMSRPIKFFEYICLPTFSSAGERYERNLSVNCIQSGFKSCETDKNYHSMHFEYDFEEGQEVYFSLVPPYSYSKLMKFLAETEQNSTNLPIKVEIACNSQLGNTIPALIISHRQKVSQKVILITARQHPCETVGSFVCESLVKVLLSGSEQSQQILQKYTFFILPMLNPDGVIHGNSRTNMLGYDINRTWGAYNQNKSNQCKNIWKYLQAIVKRGFQIEWAIDLHGHSKELGYFTYFSEENDETLIFQHNLKSKSPYYAFNYCTFGLGNSKKESLRGQLYSRMKIFKSMTIESSYYGFLNEEQRFEHWSESQYAQMALNILQSILQTDRTMKEKEVKQALLRQIAKNPKVDRIGTPMKQQQTYSDSDPEDGYLREEQREEDNLQLARLKIQQISTKKSVPIQTITNFRESDLQIKRSQSRQIMDAKEVKREVKVNFKLMRKSSRKLSKSYEQKSDLSISNMNILQERRKLRPSLIRETRQSKLRRKVYSEHKYLISSLSQVPKEEADDQFQAPLKKSISLKNSSKVSNLLRRKTEWDPPKSDAFQSRQSVRLQTILYPTSHNAAFSLSCQIKNLRSKVKSLRGADSSNEKLMNTFSSAFYLRRSKRR